MLQQNKIILFQAVLVDIDMEESLHGTTLLLEVFSLHFQNIQLPPTTPLRLNNR